MKEEYIFTDPSFIKPANDSMPFDPNIQPCMSQGYRSRGKRADIADRHIRADKENAIRPTDAALSGLRREYLQKLVDTRCSVITQHYYEEDHKLHEAFKKASVNISTSQYPRVGTAPHEIEFLDQSSSLMQSYLAEMRELRGICESFGLKTNPLLGRVFGCNAQ